MPWRRNPQRWGILFGNLDVALGPRATEQQVGERGLHIQMMDPEENTTGGSVAAPPLEAGSARRQTHGRRWWVAVLLHLLALGLGQLYNGQAGRGVLYFSAAILSYAIVPLSLACGLAAVVSATFFVLAALVWLLAFADATAQLLRPPYLAVAGSSWCEGEPQLDDHCEKIVSRSPGLHAATASSHWRARCASPSA